MKNFGKALQTEKKNDWLVPSNVKNLHQKHFTLQRLVSCKRSHKVKQTCSFQLQVCLSMFQWTPATKGLILIKNSCPSCCVKSVRIRSFYGPYFPAFALGIQCKCGKIPTRKTPDTDTFSSVSAVILQGESKIQLSVISKKDFQKQSSRGVLQKKVFLEISRNSQENTCAGVSFLIKFQASRPATLLKKRLWHRCFPVNFGKFLRILFFIEHLWWLPLDFQVLEFSLSL